MSSSKSTILITGGAGFVGSNLARRLLAFPGVRVRVFDNFSRRGVLHNAKWLLSLAEQASLELVEGDVRDADALSAAAKDADEIYHLAAQVAVTTSICDPRTDFDVNALGTFHALEAARQSGRNPFFLFTSTNKVYGSLADVPVSVRGTRYMADAKGFDGVNEEQQLDFHSPYGCSKGAADQYVRDYARIYDLDTVVFRMSCIAGQRQFGNEDQGWVAHFLYSILQGRAVSICGDGFQVRDILHVDDLVDAMLAARAARHLTRGQVFNVGGAMARTVSVIELLKRCESRTGARLNLHYVPTRPGDQPLYISNTGRLEGVTGWKAQRSIDDILDSIEDFWVGHRAEIDAEFPRSDSTAAVNTVLMGEPA